jgi:uncharacterized cupredoxin-like copper-binding protein
VEGVKKSLFNLSTTKINFRRREMKRITLLFILVLVTLLVAACGSVAPTATQVPVQPATEAPAATEPVPVTAGTQVDITLADNTIDTPMTSFQVGVPYTFVISNTGTHAHNFNINQPVSVAGSMEQALDSALLVVPQEQLAPGQTATVQFTFPDTAAGQLLEFSCLIRRHYDDGMKVDITVTQ